MIHRQFIIARFLHLSAGSPSRRNYSAVDFDASTDEDEIEAAELPEDDGEGDRRFDGGISGAKGAGGSGGGAVGGGRGRKISETSATLEEEDMDSDVIDYGISGDVTVMPKVWGSALKGGRG